jgi:hypothetical protein
MILSLCRLVLQPRSVHVGFVVNKVALGQVFLPVLSFSPVNVIPAMLHTLSFIYYPHCILSLLDSILEYNTHKIL